MEALIAHIDSMISRAVAVAEHEAAATAHVHPFEPAATTPEKGETCFIY